MNIEQIRARLSEIESELRNMNEAAGDAALSAEQQSRWDELEAEHRTLGEQGAAWERRQEFLRVAAANPANHVPGDQRQVAAPQISVPREIDTSDIRSLSVADAREAALRRIASSDVALDLPTRAQQDLERKVRKDTDIARRLVVTENEDYRSAFVKLVTRPTPILTSEEARAVQAFEEYRAMSDGTNASGGFGIPVLIDPSIILTTQGASNPFLQICRQVNITTNAWKGVNSAGVTWSFDAEGSAVSDDSPTLAQPTVSVFMARGFIPYSIEVGMDYPDFASEMATLLDAGYSDLLLSKFSTGSGTGEPKGIITALDANTTDEVLLTTAGSLGNTDLYNVWKNLPQRFRQNAGFMMSVGVNNAVRQFGTANVYHAYSINLPEGWTDSLFGRPVYESAYFPDVVATTGHTNQIVVGDWSNYLIARRAGMTVELVPTLFDQATARPSGQRGWFAYARIGADVVNNNGFRLLNQT